MTDKSEPLVMGVEMGGTKCVAVLARGGAIVARETCPTADPASTIGRLTARLRQWGHDHRDIAALGIASFGPVGLDPAQDDFGHITNTPKPGWSGVDIRGMLGRGFEGPIGFDTDVTAAALAEGRWGASRGVGVHVYLTIGTGVGGGLVVGGRPVHGRVHPEIGHVRVRRGPDDDFAGVCPYHGDCVEGLISGPAIAARTGRDAGALADDDPVWRPIADTLAELVAMLLMTVSAERVLIGGGVGVDRGFLLPMVRAGVAARLAGYVPGYSEGALAAIIRAPALGHDAGPLGAAALALACLEA